MADFKFNFDSPDNSTTSDFKFNFGSSDTEAKESAGSGDADICDSGQEACEVPWTPCHQLMSSNKVVKSMKHCFGKFTLLTANSEVVEHHILQQQTNSSDSKVVKAITEHFDLVAGQYEGGLRVWEGSCDLCQYLVDSDTPVANTKVLELGCGAGLPGLLAAKLGAASVHFQDFNQEVIELFTMSNVSLNNVESSMCSFFAGDWASFASLANQNGHRYDLILTSETIYNVKSYPKLLRVFSLLLEETGVVLVAAKNDYFGVGGGVLSFTDFMQASQQFVVDTVKRIDAGLPRLILRVTRTDKSHRSHNAPISKD